MNYKPEKMILCRVAWMKYYQGRANIDIPRSGAKYIMAHKTGGEIYNFKNINGKVYGYFPNISNLSLQNLGNIIDEDQMNNVTVVFCATHPTEKVMRVVGWYKKAVVYNSIQYNSIQNENYHAIANYNDSHRIPEEDRIFKLPYTFGRSALFYFSLHPEKCKLLIALKKYIANYGTVKVKARKKKGLAAIKGGKAYQQDIEKRVKVEKKAVNLAIDYYSSRYGGEKNIKSVETEKKGWDLEVEDGKINLNIEVKGLSGDILNVGLTPNEFLSFNKCSTNYHLFIATKVLTRKPIIRVFKYQKKGKIWVADDKSILNKEIKRSAVLTID